MFYTFIYTQTYVYEQYAGKSAEKVYDDIDRTRGPIGIYLYSFVYDGGTQHGERYGGIAAALEQQAHDKQLCAEQRILGEMRRLSDEK